MGDGFVLPGYAPEEFWIASLGTPSERLVPRLTDFIVADEVEVEDPPESTVPTGGARSGFYFRGRRQEQENWEWILPEAEPFPAEVLSAQTLDGQEIELRRIRDGIPSVPRDIGPSDLPNEGGLDEAAISYTKGCYLGQEVMARVKTMGRIRRRLMRVAGPGEVPSLPAPLFQEGRGAGELRTAAGPDGGWIGLAMISLGNLTQAALGLAADGPQDLRVISE